MHPGDDDLLVEIGPAPGGPGGHGGEVLGRDADGPSRRTVALVVALLLVVGGLGGLAWWDDGRARDREVAALRACESTLVDADHAARHRLASMYEYLRPALADLDVERGAALLGEMSRPAQASLPAVRDAAAGCRRVSVRSWHGDLERRRTRAVAFADGLATWLSGTARQGTVFVEGGAGVDRLRQRADLPGD